MPFDTLPLVEQDEVLRQILEAKSLIEKGWCKDNQAKAGRKYVAVDDPSATNFCMIGALRRAGAFENIRRYQKPPAVVLIETEILKHYDSIPNYNDAPHRRKQHVIALLNRVIEKRRIAILNGEK
jgi:hypothetical protein